MSNCLFSIFVQDSSSDHASNQERFGYFSSIKNVSLMDRASEREKKHFSNKRSKGDEQSRGEEKLEVIYRQKECAFISRLFFVEVCQEGSRSPFRSPISYSNYKKA